jgi:hypothetical protein
MVTLNGLVYYDMKGILMGNPAGVVYLNTSSCSFDFPMTSNVGCLLAFNSTLNSLGPRMLEPSKLFSGPIPLFAYVGYNLRVVLSCKVVVKF